MVDQWLGRLLLTCSQHVRKAVKIWLPTSLETVVILLGGALFQESLQCVLAMWLSALSRWLFKHAQRSVSSISAILKEVK